MRGKYSHGQKKEEKQVATTLLCSVGWWVDEWSPRPRKRPARPRVNKRPGLRDKSRGSGFNIPAFRSPIVLGFARGTPVGRSAAHKFSGSRGKGAVVLPGEAPKCFRFYGAKLQNAWLIVGKLFCSAEYVSTSPRHAGGSRLGAESRARTIGASPSGAEAFAGFAQQS